jgi:hypothetical protein
MSIESRLGAGLGAAVGRPRDELIIADLLHGRQRTAARYRLELNMYHLTAAKPAVMQSHADFFETVRDDRARRPSHCAVSLSPGRA